MTHYFDKLTPRQLSVVRNLDEEYSVIGCGEDIAKALCVANTRRPALVKRRHATVKTRANFGALWEFALTAEGVALKQAHPDL